MDISRQLPSRYIFSGASGMLGRALRAAVGREGRVLQLVRHAPATPDQFFWNPEASSPVASTEWMEGAEAAIHLSGANVAAQRWTPAYKRQMYASRVQSTHALCTMLAGLRRPPRALLVASATGIYGDRGDELLDEESTPGAGYIADLCRAWEEAAQPAAAAGIRVVHLRFGVVLDKSGGALAKMLPAFRCGLGGRLGRGQQWMSWIALPDAVSAVEFLLRTPGLAGAVNVVAPHAATNAQFTATLARQLHRPAIFPAPAWILKLVLGEMAEEVLLASARVLPRRLQGAGFEFSRPSLAEALAG